MVVKLYYDAMSQPSRAVLIFLRANSKIIPSQEVPVALRKREHLTEEFGKVNPFKKVPVIDHDGFKLPERLGRSRIIKCKFVLIIMNFYAVWLFCGTYAVLSLWLTIGTQKIARNKLGLTSTWRGST